MIQSRPICFEVPPIDNDRRCEDSEIITTLWRFAFHKMDEIAAEEADRATFERKVQAIVQQSDENFDESQIFSTIGTLEEGLRHVMNEVHGLHSELQGIEKNAEHLKKRMDKCSKLARSSTE